MHITSLKNRSNTTIIIILRIVCNTTFFLTSYTVLSKNVLRAHIFLLFFWADSLSRAFILVYLESPLYIVVQKRQAPFSLVPCLSQHVPIGGTRL